MTPEQFVYWLQGFVELGGETPPTKEQWESIAAHLRLVFNKKTPEVKKAEPNEQKKEISIDDYAREWERIKRESEKNREYPPFSSPYVLEPKIVC